MWKALPEWEGWYEVSDNGKVRSVDRWITFSDGRKRHYKGVLLSTYQDKFGYLKVTLKQNGKDFRAHVHVLVARAFHGPRPKGHVVRHRDGNYLRNTKRNLVYGTVKENVHDMMLHGTGVKGERVHCAVLTEAKVREIRAAKGTVAELAEHFGVSRTTLWNVQNRKRWGWLP